MPKLPAGLADKVDQAEGQDFSPFDPGTYRAKLLDVTVSDKPGQSGSHYWTWEYQIVDEGPANKRKIRDITSLSENALFRFKAVFAAFGVPTNTDTDELIGRTVILQIGVRTIQSGDRTGEKANNVKNVLPDPDAQAPGAPDPGWDDEEEPF